MAPLHIYESQYPMPFLPQQSLFDFLLPSAPGISPLPDRDPSLPAFVDGLTGRTLTRADVRDAALRLATGIRSLGLKRGDTATIWAGNSIEWVLATWGLMAAGLCNSPANIAYEPKELAHQVNDSGSQLIFVSPELLATFEEARKLFKWNWPDSRVVMLCEDDKIPAGSKYKAFGELLRSKPASEPEPFNGADCNETGWLCYSSGTTGLPKGVMTTQLNFVAQLIVGSVAFPPQVSGRDSALCFLPLSHMYGLYVTLFQPIMWGTFAVVLPRFDEIQVLTAIEKYKCSLAYLVPPVLLILVHSTNVPKYDISSLRTVQSGAAVLGPELAAAFKKRFPHCRVVQAYGMTETSPAVTQSSIEDADSGHLGVGRILPSYQVRLVRDDGSDAPVGERGELWCRGPNIMKGYHNNPEATAKTMAPGNWLKTGDVLVMNEDGLLHVVDRVKELIKYKGFQVAPAEMEAVLLSHPKIVDAGVVGVFDQSQATELPRAYIVVSPDSGIKSLDQQLDFAKEVQAWVAARVAQHKRFRGGVVVTVAIPKSPSGKILRRHLRDRAAAEFCSVEQSRL